MQNDKATAQRHATAPLWDKHGSFGNPFQSSTAFRTLTRHHSVTDGSRPTPLLTFISCRQTVSRLGLTAINSAKFLLTPLDRYGFEIYGPESSGKTTLTLQVIAEAQKLGGVCAFIDAEHALDPIYAQALGVDTDELLVSQPDTGEEALEICDMVVRSGAVDIVVIDSVAALTPRAEIEGKMGDAHVGLQARLMSQALRKMTGNIKQSNTLVIFINQLRMKIGVMYGSPETTTGGNALKFYSSVRLDIRRVTAVKDGDEIVGNETRVKVAKNKVAPPFKTAEFQILYGKGIHRLGEIIEFGVKQGIVEKSGAWYSYKEDRIGQGRKNVANFLSEHPEICDEIENRVRAELLPGTPGASDDKVIALDASRDVP